MSATAAERQWAAPVALFLLALLLRALPFGRVFDETRTVFAGNDAWYHMRRVRDSLERGNWPAPIDFDPLLNWPHGARPIWTPLFDGFVTTVVLPFHAVGGMAAAEVAAAWIPPVLGALCVVVLYFTVREIADEATARIAGALLAVLVGHTWYSQVGFVDHHVAVTAAAAAMLFTAVRFARAPGFARSIALSACEATALLIWPGALIHVVLVELGLGLALARAPSDAASRAYAQRAWGHTFSLLVVAPFCLGQEWVQWGDYAATVLSRFQPLLFGMLGLHAALCSRRVPGDSERKPARRAAFTLGIGVGLVLASGALIPGLRESVSEAWQWFGREEAFQASVSESAPLLYRAGKFTTRAASLRLSWFFGLLPLMWIAFMWTAWASTEEPRSAARSGAIVFGTWALGLVLAAFAQTRFAHSASLAAAFLVAWSLRALFPAVARRTTPRLATLGLATLAALALAPSLRLHTETLAASLRGELTTANHSKRRLLETADWLREQSTGPPTGVLAPWHLGHPLLYVSELPTVVGNFGDDVGPENFELHREYFRSTEARAVRLLDSVDTRFVVIESLAASAREQFGPRTMLHRLTLPTLRNVEQHRLRYASHEDERPPGTTAYRVFERVPGAALEGRAPGGATVTARMRVGRSGAPIGIAVVTTEANDAGHYSLRLPQAGSDSVAGKWQVAAGEQTTAVEVPEAAVLGGETLIGPDFSGGAD